MLNISFGPLLKTLWKVQLDATSCFPTAQSVTTELWILCSSCTQEPKNWFCSMYSKSLATDCVWNDERRIKMGLTGGPGGPWGPFGPSKPRGPYNKEGKSDWVIPYLYCKRRIRTTHLYLILNPNLWNHDLLFNPSFCTESLNQCCTPWWTKLIITSDVRVFLEEWEWEGG